jgi:hypothetical protein
MRCISIVRSLYFKIFSASFLITFFYYAIYLRHDSAAEYPRITTTKVPTKAHNMPASTIL